MDTYSKKQPIISRIRNYIASAAIFAASAFPSYAQDVPKTEQKPAVKSIDENVEEFKRPFSPSHIFLPQRLNSTYLGGGFSSGQGDNDSSRTIFEGNLRMEDFTQTPAGLYFLTESGKKKLKTVAPEDTENFTFDGTTPGTFDASRKNDSKYALFGGNIFDAIFQVSTSKDTADKRYRLFQILNDDPGTPILQTSQNDLDSKIESEIDALRVGYTYAPFSVMLGAFKRKSETLYNRREFNEITGIINFQSTESLNQMSETELKGYLFALEAEIVKPLKLGTEVWIVSGDRTFSEAYFNDETAPPVIDTFTSGKEDAGYKQFAFNIRGNHGPFIGSLQVGKRQNDGSIDDQTFYMLQAGVKLGSFLLNGVMGKDAQIGNTFIGGNAVIGSYTMEDLEQLTMLGSEVVGMTFNGDPTYSGAQGLANRVRHVERIASKPGFLAGAYSWEDAAEKKLLLADVAANVGYGFTLQLAGTVISDDDSASATGYLHYNAGPFILSLLGDYADTKGLDAEKGYGGLLIVDGGKIYRWITGAKD